VKEWKDKIPVRSRTGCRLVDRPIVKGLALRILSVATMTNEHRKRLCALGPLSSRCNTSALALLSATAEWKQD
jgi:hypothetical protein